MPREVPDPELNAKGMVRINMGFLQGSKTMRKSTWERLERNRVRRERAAKKRNRLRERAKRYARKKAKRLAGNAKKARLKDPKHCRHKRERKVKKAWSGRVVYKCTNCGRERKA
jgi:hypothetical protein